MRGGTLLARIVGAILGVVLLGGMANIFATLLFAAASAFSRWGLLPALVIYYPVIVVLSAYLGQKTALRIQRHWKHMRELSYR
jgi:hypothetical protein